MPAETLRVAYQDTTSCSWCGSELRECESMETGCCGNCRRDPVTAHAHEASVHSPTLDQTRKDA